MLTCARGQVLALGNFLDCLMTLNDDAADTIDRKVNSKAYTDGAATNNNNISLHELRVDQAHG